MGITTLKLLHKEAQDMRRIKVCDLSGIIGRTGGNPNQITFDDLKNYAFHAFPVMKEHPTIYFYYLDDENEQVRITNEAEFIEGLRLIENEQESHHVFKIIVSNQRQANTDTCETFDAECSMALFVDLSRLLEKWECTPDQVQMKQEMVSLLHEPQLQTVFVDLISDLQFATLLESMTAVLKRGGSIPEGIKTLFSSGKINEITCTLIEKCPQSRELIENIVQSMQVQTIPPIQDSRINGNTGTSTVLPDFPEDPKIVHKGLEFVTGQLYTDISNLTNDQAGDVMLNCGVDFNAISALSRESRILWIANTILKIQSMKQSAKLEKSLARDDGVHYNPKDSPTEKNSNGIMDADDVDNKPSACFIGDISYPDGSTLRAGEHFVKTWRLKNDGLTRWPAKTRLVCVGGDHLELSSEAVYVPILPPGKMIDVSIEMKAPLKSNRYTGYWRLCTPDNVRFGHRLWVDILVSEQFEPLQPSVSKQAKPQASNEICIQAPVAMMSLSTDRSVSIPAAAPIVTQHNKEVKPAAVVAQKKPYQYEAELNTLRSMGFSNETLNMQLLDQYKGDINGALNDLFT